VKICCRKAAPSPRGRQQARVAHQVRRIRLFRHGRRRSDPDDRDLPQAASSISRIPTEKRGAIYFRNGIVIDAELGAWWRRTRSIAAWCGAKASSRSSSRTFRARTYRAVVAGLLRMACGASTSGAGCVMQLPPLETVFESTYRELASARRDFPTRFNGILRLFRRAAHADAGPSTIATSSDLEALIWSESSTSKGLIYARRTGSAPRRWRPISPISKVGCKSRSCRPSREPGGDGGAGGRRGGPFAPR